MNLLVFDSEFQLSLQERNTGIRMINPMQLILTVSLVLIAAIGDASAGEQRPNVVVIMADDLGYGDVSCYGATKISTPNIDRLASQGMRFTDAHSAASLCSPSRYGLITGRYPWRLHKKGNGYKIEPGRETIASMFQDRGYRSAAIGKWHLGYGRNWEKPLSPGPLEAGFDYHFGVPTNHNDKYRAYVENHDFVGLEPGQSLRVVPGQPFPSGLAEPRIEDQVDTTLTQKSLDFIRENAHRPFFLYFTPCAPHTHVTPAGPFRGSSQAGLFGDYVQELDAHVGQILDTLDELKLADNTLVVFTSDNGSTPKDFKGTQGVVLNLQDETGDIREKFKTAKRDAKALGHITNGPWRDGKGKPYEGGHRVPLIVRWPGRVSPATSSSHTVCLTDLYATAADVVDGVIPGDAAEDSISFLPTLLGDTSPVGQRQYAFIQGDGRDDAIAVRYRTWKLIASKGENGHAVSKLYDLSIDPGESNDVSDDNPGVVREMLAALDQASRLGRTRTATATAFRHPGVSHSAGSIDFVRDQIAHGRQPWKDAWGDLSSSRLASLNWTARPHARVERGAHNRPDIGASDFMRDGSAAYTHTLIWVLKGDEAHAEKAAEVLDAWSDKLESIGNHDAKLLIGMAGLRYCNAAELLKHTWDGWPEERQKRFRSMLRNVWYPVIEDFFPSANGNWDASMLQTMIAMGVFLDDREMFDRAVNYYRSGHGNGAIGNYFNEFGECQESGRDQTHTQMGLEFLANTCETAWIQGVDLYGELDNRLLLGFEYTAKYNLGNEVPYERFQSFDGRYDYKRISAEGRGRLRPMYEKVFNHYHNRKSLQAPYTGRARSEARPESRRHGSSLPWDTLMFADLPSAQSQ